MTSNLFLVTLACPQLFDPFALNDSNLKLHIWLILKTTTCQTSQSSHSSVKWKKPFLTFSFFLHISTLPSIPVPRPPASTEPRSSSSHPSWPRTTRTRPRRLQKSVHPNAAFSPTTSSRPRSETLGPKSPLSNESKILKALFLTEQSVFYRYLISGTK